MPDAILFTDPVSVEIIRAAMLAMVQDNHTAQDNLTHEQWTRAEEILADLTMAIEEVHQGPMAKPDLHLFAEWDEDTEISWWNKGRAKLNAVVRMVNDWQIKSQFDKDAAPVILAHIELGERTWAGRDGGENWLAHLTEMREFINRSLGVKHEKYGS